MAEPKPILSRHLITEDLRTGGRGRIERVWEADAVLSHHFRCRLWRRGWCTSRTSSDHLFGPQHELPPVRLVIHRQTSAHERRKWTRSVQSRSCILAYLCTRQHWLWITVELHISGARHREAVAREGGRYAPVHRVSGSEPLSPRTHRHRGRSRPLRSAVVEYQAPCGLTPTLREDWACKRTLETPCHARIAPVHRTQRPCFRITGLSWHGTLVPQGAITS